MSSDMPAPTVTTAPASESGHWYQRDGTLVKLIDGKRPDFRNKLTRKHNLCPGITSVMREKSAPQLLTYIKDQVLQAALTNPGKRPGESDKDWKDRILVEADRHRDDAATAGTAIHAAIEQSFRCEPWSPIYDDHVRQVRALVDSVFPGEAWQAEKSAVHAYGYATKIDLASPRIVINWKGTDKPTDKLAVYDSHWMQEAAELHALGIPDGRAFIGYVNRFTGSPTLIEVPKEKLALGWDMFLACLRLWQIRNRYRPEWAVPFTV